MSTSQVLDTGYYYIVNDQWRNHVGVCDWDQHGNHVIKAEVQDISDNAKVGMTITGQAFGFVDD